MPEWILVAVVAIVFAVAAAWLVRRLLDADIGWIRSIVTSLAMFFFALPVALWTLAEADIYRDGRFAVDSAVTVAFVALTLGWMLAAVVVAVLTLEFLWPSRGFRNPIVVVRDALRRRDRARRYAQILVIGSRHGLGAYQGHRRGRRELSSSLVAAINEAGVTFVKLGQVLSTREDLLPADLIAALSTLQMDSTPIPWAEAEAAIRTQLGRPLEEVFAEIDPVPMAAASVAQVHAARLVGGEQVVVKIQRPRARAQVTTDLDILDRLAAEAERHLDWAREYGTTALAAEFARALREELDYRVEAANTEMVRGAIAKWPSLLRVPKVYTEYSTAQMLVQERATGTPLSVLAPGAVPPGRAAEIADALLEAVFDQIAVRGVFHADLHPGNLVLADDGTITLIDFGSVGVLEHSTRRLLVPFLVGMANDDDVAVTDVALILCAPVPGSSPDQATLQRDIGAILTRVHNSPTPDNVFRLLIDALRRNRMALPPSLLLVFRTLASFEGTLHKLVPDYNLVARALEIAPRVALRATSPRQVMLSAQTWSTLLLEEVRRLPRRIDNITRSLDEGTLSVQVRAFDTAEERTWVDALLGRVTTMLVGIALIVSGIMLGVADGGPQLTGEISVYAFVGSITGLGGLLLLLRSLRNALRRRDRSSS